MLNCSCTYFVATGTSTLPKMQLAGLIGRYLKLGMAIAYLRYQKNGQGKFD